MWRWLLRWVLRFSWSVPVVIWWSEAFLVKWMGIPRYDCTLSGTRVPRASRAPSPACIFWTMDSLISLQVFRLTPYRGRNVLVFLPRVSVFRVDSGLFPHAYLCLSPSFIYLILFSKGLNNELIICYFYKAEILSIRFELVSGLGCNPCTHRAYHQVVCIFKLLLTCIDVGEQFNLDFMVSLTDIGSWSLKGYGFADEKAILRIIKCIKIKTLPKKLKRILARGYS